MVIGVIGGCGDYSDYSVFVRSRKKRDPPGGIPKGSKPKGNPRDPREPKGMVPIEPNRPRAKGRGTHRTQAQRHGEPKAQRDPKGQGGGETKGTNGPQTNIN